MLVIYNSILVFLRIQIKATIIKVGDRPPLPIIITVEVQRRDALPATRGSHVGVRVPEPVVIALQEQRRAAALVRSPSPRKTPHKFRGSTIYPPPHVEVPVPTSPGF